MSIYIKGMEMPQNCHGCPLVDYLENCPCHKMPDHNFWDSALLEFAVHEDCPIGEVQPHGDLIDRDKMREIIKPWSPEDEITGCTFDTVKKLMHTMISRTPVVIPADKEDK